MSFLEKAASLSKKKKKKNVEMSVKELLASEISNQLKLLDGTQVIGRKNKPLKSWRNAKGEVSIKVGTHPLILDNNEPVIFTNVDEAKYKSLLYELKKDLETGDIDDLINDLEKRI